MRFVTVAFLAIFLTEGMAFAIGASTHGKRINTESGYQVFEGNVTRIMARTLVIDGQNFPVSMFARVYKGSLRGQEIPLHVVVNVGKIDRAKLYVLRGKVEKIVVIKNDM